MIRKYKLVACLPPPVSKTFSVMAMEGSHLTETGLDPCLTADQHSALLHRDLNWTAISKYQETEKSNSNTMGIFGL